MSDPFRAIPQAARNVEACATAAGGLQLRRRIISASRIVRYLESRLGWRRDARVNLDEHGAYFWHLIDGQRNLRAIAKCVRNHWGIYDEESRRATLHFTRDLMARGLIQLEIPPKKAAAERARGGAS